MLRMFAFSRHRFDTAAKANALLERLDSSPYAPVAFNSAEPIRRKLTAATRAHAASLLSGAPQYRAGSLFLRSKTPKATLSFRWVAGATSRWFADLDSKVLTHRGGRDHVTRFLLGLFREFPVVFSGVASDSEWNAKHWIREKEDGGEVSTKLGLDLQQCLPGVYWMTVFGEKLASYFGRQNLLSSDAQAVDLDEAGVAVILRADPMTERGRLETEEQRLITSLGEEYFFDITAPKRVCTGIPGVTAGS